MLRIWHVYPGSEFFPSRIRIKEIKYFNQKKMFLSSRKYDPGCSSRILTFYPSRGLKRPRIPDPEPFLLLMFCFFLKCWKAEHPYLFPFCWAKLCVFYLVKSPVSLRGWTVFFSEGLNRIHAIDISFVYRPDYADHPDGYPMSEMKLKVRNLES
jgi:hypothetical protein